MDITVPLIDTFGRIHTNLRVSVTDRCNIRCFYCMPETVRFLPRAEILTYEEIERLVRVVAQMGVNKLRIRQLATNNIPVNLVFRYRSYHEFE